MQTIPSDKYEDKEKVRNRKRQTPYIYMYVYIEKENSELKKLKDEDKEKEKHRTRLDAHNLYTGKETVKDVRQVEKLVCKNLRRDCVQVPETRRPDEVRRRSSEPRTPALPIPSTAP